MYDNKSPIILRRDSNRKVQGIEGPIPDALLSILLLINARLAGSDSNNLRPNLPRDVRTKDRK